MTTSARKKALLLALPAMLAAKPPMQTNAPSISGVLGCRTLTSDVERLTCYDKAAAALETAVTQHDITVLDRQEVRKTRRSLFGFTFPNLAIFGVGDKEDDNSPEFAELDTTIRSVVSVSYGKWDMTIEDGAVWRNIDLLDFKPNPGDKVHIKRGMIGSYFFKIGSDRAIKAMRLR